MGRRRSVASLFVTVFVVLVLSVPCFGQTDPREILKNSSPELIDAGPGMGMVSTGTEKASVTAGTSTGSAYISIGLTPVSSPLLKSFTQILERLTKIFEQLLGIAIAGKKPSSESKPEKPEKPSKPGKPGTGTGTTKDPTPGKVPGKNEKGGKALLGWLQAVGFKGDALRTAWAIGMRESGGNPKAYNGNAGTGDKSYGLFQINMINSLGPARRKQYGLKSNEELFDPLVNAKVAYKMSKGGKDFGAWAVGPNAYRHSAQLDAAFKKFYNQFPPK